MKIEQKEENKRTDEEHKETLESVITGVKKTNKCVLGCLGLFEWSPWTWSTHGSKVTRSRGSNSIPGTYQQQKQGGHHYCQAELSLILVDGSVSVWNFIIVSVLIFHSSWYRYLNIGRTPRTAKHLNVGGPVLQPLLIGSRPNFESRLLGPSLKGDNCHSS